MLVIHLVMLVNATAMAAVGHHSGRRHLRAPLPGAELQRPLSMRRVQPAGLRVAHPGYDLLRAQQPVGGLPARRLRPGEGLQARPELGRGGGRRKPGGRPEAELQREAVGLKQPAWGAHTRHRQVSCTTPWCVCVCGICGACALNQKGRPRETREGGRASVRSGGGRSGRGALTGTVWAELIELLHRAPEHERARVAVLRAGRPEAVGRLRVQEGGVQPAVPGIKTYFVSGFSCGCM